MIPASFKTNLINNLVFLDVETTGLSVSKGSKICELAMLKIEDGKETVFNKLINPLMPIPKECYDIHGITDEMVANCPSFYEVANEVAEFINGFVLVGHNAKFDLHFISSEIKCSGIISPEMYYLDTLKIARQYFSFESNKLGAIAEILGIDVKEHHRAMADVITTKQVAEYLFGSLYRKGVDYLEPEYFEQALLSKNM
ncbi:PolC-type DNA polymerase III [Candidatus Ruminimicrobium bovinum]|uniref:3'-5' exonuclease n=1 Tax=Candidatus Ruminimicrobium bovinum TaxID=3242779 RepID=UPI0039B95384